MATRPIRRNLISSPFRGNNGESHPIPRFYENQEGLSGSKPFGAVVLRRPRWSPLQYYAGGLTAVAIAFAGALLAWRVSLDAPLVMVLGLALVALLAEKQSIRLGPHVETSVSVLPILFAAVVYGPLAAMIVAACALMTVFGRPYTRWVIWTSTRVLSGGVAGVVAILVLSGSTSTSRLLLAVAAAVVTEAVVNIFLTIGTATLRRNLSVEAMAMLGRLLVATVPLYAPLVAILAYAFTKLSPWTALFFFVPAVAAHRLLILYRKEQQLSEELVAANVRLERANISFASALVAALDAGDEYTAGHSAAVAVYARDIAQKLGLPPEEQQLAHLSGLLHDIGKVGLPAGMLEKNGSLTLDERRLMEEHCVIGERILANVEDYSAVARIVRHHHERVDGNGYPDCLRGDEIPLVSRIIAVADAYNAMTSGRPYRDAMPSGIARTRLMQAVGTQFDISVVAAFETILADASESYLCGARADFAVEAQRHPSLASPSVAAA